jgi:hypothetical protein
MRTFALVLVVALALAVAGCQRPPAVETDTGSSTPAEATATSSVETPALPPESDEPPVVEDASPGRPSNAEMVAAAKRLAQASGAILVQGAKFGDATQDSQGRWWAEVDILNDIDGAIVIIYRDGAVWKLHDAGTGIEPGDLPPDVKLNF